MRTLDDIDTFGAIDAESDELLTRCFEVHPSFRQAVDSRRFLIVGRKGSGKTAIYKRILGLQREQSTLFSVGHTFSDYPWYHHDAQVVAEAAEQERYLHSWKYLILLSMAKILLNFDQSQPYSEDAGEALGKIENFVVDTYGSRDPDVTELFHPGKTLRHLKNLNVDLKFLKVESGRDEVAMNLLPRVFQDVNRSLQDFIIRSLNPTNQYFVCFDQLDIGFNPSSTQYQQRLIGLILAARDFANASREAGKFMKVLIFLRSDIYQKSLLFEDKNKITDTYKIDLEWDRPGGTTLRTVMSRRFIEVLGAAEDPWSTVFDETNEMRGHQSKYQHILDRTFRRPRDIIKFTNCVLDAYKQRRREKGGVQVFTNEDVNTAHGTYGNYLREEITDEIYRYHTEHQIYFEILRQIGYQQFTVKEFDEAYERWKDRMQGPILAGTILEDLYHSSVIGFYRAGGSGYGGSEYVYKYLDERVEFNAAAERFRVHWGLVEALGLRQFAR